ncbi:hypothetical protein L209DRAFT_542609 [Thermothelomyces heterothallicus CBS 203.75]
MDYRGANDVSMFLSAASQGTARPPKASGRPNEQTRQPTGVSVAATLNIVGWHVSQSQLGEWLSRLLSASTGLTMFTDYRVSVVVVYSYVLGLS